MTKGMGIVMLVLYILFVVITLGFSYEWYTCPI
jgi:Na+-transporting methylmalonyl-CoA/oxaloacetate decarboxylase gamma subunit